jgi:hypothetical protein
MLVLKNVSKWWESSRGRSETAWLGLACVVYGLALLVLRPASPFEWDEVLFQGALDRYDVGAHLPHPPGYPAYVAAGRAVRLLVGDPLLALQLVGIAAAVMAVAWVTMLARRLGAEPGPAAAAGLLLAVTPAFAFNANVGLSDVLGAAAAVATVLLLVRAWDDPRAMPLAAAVCAAGMAVRPQVAAASLLVGIAVVARAVRAGKWRWIGLAALAGVAVSVVFWAPAVLLTGAQRFVRATQVAHRWVTEVEVGYRLPQAPLGKIVEHWLVRPFGGRNPAIAMWLLVGWGTWRWVRVGRGRLAAVAAAAGFGYLVLAVFTLNFTTSVRYVLPALPFLLLLAAGSVAGDRRGLRRAGAAVVAVWAIGVTARTLPVYRLRQEVAPPWAALEWVRAHYRADRTTVVYDEGFAPHAKHLLRSAGFAIVPAREAPACGQSLRPEGDVVYVVERPVPGQDVLVARTWRSPKLRKLTRNRYYEAVVLSPPAAGQPCFSPAWRLRAEGDWSLFGTGTIELPEGAPSRLVTVRAGTDALRVAVAGRAEQTVLQGEPLAVELTAGKAGAISVSPPGKVTTRLDPLRFDRLDPGVALSGTTPPRPRAAPGEKGGTLP